MKKSDFAMIILIASASIMIAYFVGNALIGSNTNAGEKVKTIDSISTDVTEPDPEVFNAQAINPSVKVNINSGQDSTVTQSSN